MPRRRRIRGSRGSDGPARPLPRLEGVRAFESAARHKSFVHAGDELDVTAATIAQRVKTLEDYMGGELFTRSARGVRLNARGLEYLSAIAGTLDALSRASERCRTRYDNNRLKLVTVEVFAEKWLMPRLADFRSQHPEIALEFETDHGEVSRERRQFDIWIPFANGVDEELHSEVLFDETLLPVCSPDFLAVNGRPTTAAELHDLPLLYDLHWNTYWAHWFAEHEAKAPDLMKASGFRLYSMMVQAAVKGMGVALGHSRMIAAELRDGELVVLFESPIRAPGRYLLVTQPVAERNARVQAFCTWIRNAVAEHERAARTAGEETT